MSCKRPIQMVIRGLGSFGPEAETQMPCPCCGKGMVAATRALLVKEALKDEPEPLPSLNTAILETLPEKE